MTDTEAERTGQAGVLGHSLKVILAEASTPEDSLAAGSAAALSVALAAALASSTARTLPAGVESFGYVVQAENLRMRAAELVDQNRDRYEAARKALEARLEDPGYRDHRIGTAMNATLDTLGLIAGAGADTAELASKVAAAAAAELKPDAVSAAVLAESGARVAAILIAANLLSANGSRELEAAEVELVAAKTATERAREALL